MFQLQLRQECIMLHTQSFKKQYVHREQSWLHTWRPEAVSYNLNLLTGGILKSRLFLCKMPGIAVATVGRPRLRYQRMRPRRRRATKRHRLNGTAHRCILLVILFGLCRRKNKQADQRGWRPTSSQSVQIRTDFAQPHFRTNIFAPHVCALENVRSN